MKQVQITVYSFDELSEKAQNRAIEKQRQYENFDYLYDECHDTVKAFHNIFGTKEGLRSWLDVRTNFDSDILNLKGLRLRTWLINNFPELYKGKYYSLWSKKEVTFEHHKNGYPVLKIRYSKIIKTKDCVLTGVCWDIDLLDPIYNFIEKYNSNCSHINIEMLINDCFESLEKEIEYKTSDSAISEELSEINFTEDGTILF